jgi:hypothetical protein
MAFTYNFLTNVITVPQADCDLVSGTFYRLPTKATFKAEIDAFFASEQGMPFSHPIDHNPDYIVAGVTFAPKVEVLAPYSVEFTPSAAWSVELTESNNNIWDIGAGILVQNQVQVIPTNSAGLIAGGGGGGGLIQSINGFP